MYNIAAFKARTKARSKFRDKRVASVSSDNWRQTGWRRSDQLSLRASASRHALTRVLTSPTCLRDVRSLRSRLFESSSRVYMIPSRTSNRGLSTVVAYHTQHTQTFDTNTVDCELFTESIFYPTLGSILRLGSSSPHCKPEAVRYRKSVW